MIKMKDSGIDWIGEIPEEWEIGKLKYSYDLFAGGDIREENFSVDYNETFCYPVLSNSKENHGIFGYSDIYRFDAGTVTVTGRGDIGYAEYREYEHFPIIRILVCVPRSILDGRFTAYWINSSVIEKNQTAVSQLTRFTLGELPLPKISFNEQTKIADYLDKKVAQLDKVKALLEAQIATLQDYRQSLIYETVTKGLDKTAPLKDSGVDWIGQIPKGWEVKRLKYLTDKIGSGKTPLGGAEIFQDEGILFLRSQNIYDTGLELETKATFISQEIHQSMASTEVKNGDVLFNITGASIGRVTLYNLNYPANVNQHVCIIRAKNSVSSKYLTYYLMSQMGKQQVSFYQVGGNREGLTFEQLRNFEILLPSCCEQEEIAVFLDNKTAQINQMLAIKQEQIENINQQRQTLIYDFVTGKRRV